MAVSKYTAGDTVKVYQKPLSHEDFEGEAKLDRLIKIHRTCPAIEEWWVLFPGEGEDPVRRFITEAPAAITSKSA